jgi:hypothetical protein
MKKFINTEWEIWHYEVWGDGSNGYEVNNRHCSNRNYPIRLDVEVYDEGTEIEFQSAYPTRKQIKDAFGLSRMYEITIDGDDTHIYLTTWIDSCPLGEMICISHDSLSPIKEIE